MKARSNEPDLVSRTRAYALAVIHFCSTMPRVTVAQILGRQLLRSATSAGAQYREAQRAKSLPDFVSKAVGTLQELDESAYWLELIVESGFASDAAVLNLQMETDELLRIFVAVTKTAKEKRFQA